MNAHGFLGDLRRGRLAGADGPDGLVGHGHPAGVLGLQQHQPLSQLPGEHLFGLPRFALGLGLAHAHDGQQAVVERGVDLLLHVLVGLAEELPPLRVADDDRSDTPRSTSMAGETSPVKAPSSSQNMSCAATLMFVDAGRAHGLGQPGEGRGHHDLPVVQTPARGRRAR